MSSAKIQENEFSKDRKNSFFLQCSPILNLILDTVLKKIGKNGIEAIATIDLHCLKKHL